MRLWSGDERGEEEEEEEDDDEGLTGGPELYIQVWKAERLMGGVTFLSPWTGSEIINGIATHKWSLPGLEKSNCTTSV
jgi:hypothetical protein